MDLPCATKTKAPARLNGKKDVLIPGRHRTLSGRIEVSNDQFADAVLGALPVDLLYRSSDRVGVLSGPKACPRFVELTPDDFQLYVDQHMRLITWTDAGRPCSVLVNCDQSLARLVYFRARHAETLRQFDGTTDGHR